MVNKRSVASQSVTENRIPEEEIDAGRRAALKGIGALAGAAPAVTVLLAPSASRAQATGSPCEGRMGCGPAPGNPTDTGAPGGDAGFLGKRQS